MSDVRQRVPKVETLSALRRRTASRSPGGCPPEIFSYLCLNRRGKTLMPHETPEHRALLRALHGYAGELQTGPGRRPVDHGEGVRVIRGLLRAAGWIARRLDMAEEEFLERARTSLYRSDDDQRWAIVPDKVKGHLALEHRATSAHGSGFVYLMWTGDLQVVKIGFSVQPTVRAMTLGAQLGFVTAAPKSVEHALHRRFKPCRIVGEWFYAPKNLLDVVCGFAPLKLTEHDKQEIARLRQRPPRVCELLRVAPIRLPRVIENDAGDEAHTMFGTHPRRLMYSTRYEEPIPERIEGDDDDDGI